MSNYKGEGTIKELLSGFSLDLLDIGGFVPSIRGGQMHGDKVLMGGLIRRDIDVMWKDLTLIDYIITGSTIIVIVVTVMLLILL